MTMQGTGGYAPTGMTDENGAASGTADQAAEVVQTAKEKGTKVTSTAADQLGDVAAETKTQARNLLHETQSQVREQAGTQKDRATGGLRSLADELRTMSARQSDDSQAGMASDLARQASEKVHALASWLDSREPGDLLEEFRALARRKPGTFLLGAAAAGLVAGRLTRGAVDAKRSEADSPADVATTGQLAGPIPAEPTAPWTETASTRAPDQLVVDPQHTYAGGERR